MAKVRVAINGYGTIGKRVADAVTKQPDMVLAGISKTRPSFEARRAAEKGYPLYVAGAGRAADFETVGLKVAGSLADLLAKADVVVDATPDKVGRENRATYLDRGLRAVFQGGEPADVAEASFNALGNYGACRGKKTLRVVSCNTTGIARAVSVLEPRWGVEHWEVTLVRRGGPGGVEERSGERDPAYAPSPLAPRPRRADDLPRPSDSDHGPGRPYDAHARARQPRASAEPSARRLRGRRAFRAMPRFHLFAPWEHVDGTPQVMEYARDRGIGFNDMMENVIWEEGVRLDKKDLYFFQAIHQESIVVPENIDAIWAMLGLAPDGPSSIAMTDRALGLATKG